MFDIMLFGAIIVIPTVLALVLVDVLGSPWTRQRSNLCIQALARTLPCCDARTPAILSDCGRHGRLHSTVLRQRRHQPIGATEIDATPIPFPAPEVRLEA